MNGLPEATFCKINVWPTVYGGMPTISGSSQSSAVCVAKFPTTCLSVSWTQVSESWAEIWVTEPDLFLQLLLLVCVLLSGLLSLMSGEGDWAGSPSLPTNQQAARDNGKCFWFLKRKHTDCVSSSPMIYVRWIKLPTQNLNEIPYRLTRATCGFRSHKASKNWGHSIAQCTQNHTLRKSPETEESESSSDPNPFVSWRGGRGYVTCWKLDLCLLRGSVRLEPTFLIVFLYSGSTTKSVHAGW